MSGVNVNENASAPPNRYRSMQEARRRAGLCVWVGGWVGGCVLRAVCCFFCLYYILYYLLCAMYMYILIYHIHIPNTNTNAEYDVSWSGRLMSIFRSKIEPRPYLRGVHDAFKMEDARCRMRLAFCFLLAVALFSRCLLFFLCCFMLMLGFYF